VQVKKRARILIDGATRTRDRYSETWIETIKKGTEVS